ncbi:MAG: helix-turn-helix domain-containing protein [Bacteroidetes bacterium]|nr:helix-turn-helix domain-containing protein [Bacteroidota bacterium]
METIVVTTEADIRKWVKEAVKESLEAAKPKEVLVTNEQEALISRKEIAGKLNISLVTLTGWVKQGLPSHKQQGRVYFLYSEVMEYIAKKRPKKKYEWIN